jgi:uncharacterized OB-fold protein
MKDLIDKATREAVRHYGDAATEEFYRRLRNREWASTRCNACGEAAFPPRSFCPACHAEDVAWFALPTRGTVYAFTQQERSIRFMKPDVIGLVDLPGVGRLLTRFNAPFEALSIGQEVELSFYEVSEQLVLHQFRPVAGAPPSAGPTEGA